MDRIIQGFVSSAVDGHPNYFLEKFGLRPYFSENEPAVFFGCYPYGRGHPRKDIQTILGHKSLAIVVWRGGDILAATTKKRRQYKVLLNKRNIRHVAISNFIEKDLHFLGKRYVRLNITGCYLDNFESCPLGNSIYTYCPVGVSVYNFELVNKLIGIFPDIKFIVTGRGRPEQCNFEHIKSLYAKCFLGIRLTNHDGLSATVLQLGLMGRRCIWNGDLSNAIPYSSIDDIVKKIKLEKSRIGTTQDSVSLGIKKDLLLPNWLELAFWEKQAEIWEKEKEKEICHKKAQKKVLPKINPVRNIPIKKPNPLRKNVYSRISRISRLPKNRVKT